MAENKKQPIDKGLLLFASFGLLAIAAFGAVLVVLSSKVTFLAAFGWIMVFFAAIFIPVTIWLYVIETTTLPQCSK
jgi:glucan phosphoethanolaminetransferase (alkaline phosphatase superfamily)